jgi:signal transduction histidine kinase
MVVKIGKGNSMMRAHSIRWRLTLSYAAIACLAALASGAVLLGVLRGYYAGQERAYLMDNAESFRALVAGAVAKDVPVDTLKPQLENLAFFSQVRIRVLDNQGQELLDTGIPNNPYMISFVYAATDRAPGDFRIQTIKLDPLNERTVTSGGVQVVGQAGGVDVWQPGGIDVWRGISSSADTSTTDSTRFDRIIPRVPPDFSAILPAPPVTEGAIPPGVLPPTGDTMVSVVSEMSLSSTFYGFSLGSASRVAQRSSQQFSNLIFDAHHDRMGVLILSDGPAYGSDIVKRVARGWLFAGGIAVLLAAAAGWLVSRQISKPLLALTDVTARMTAGDLSTRASIARQDELGVLALSFNAMADRIQDTVITLQRFVADAAHELHTPLTALRTNLELARSEHPSTAIRRAHEQVIRLEKLTDGLLALSRIEARSDPDPTDLVDLNQVIRSASELYASRAEQSGLDFELALPDHVPPVIGRADQIECAISNLVDNAIKFTPEGGSVTLRVHPFDQGRALKLVIRDTGIGIPSDELPLLFERFRRAHNASDYPGSGLGLAITRAIVRAHGGAIVAESSGTGTQITIALPVARPH